MSRTVRFGLVALAAAVCPAAAAPRHVVLLVWDGMRPDWVTQESTPNLLALARRGVFFSRHHSVFVTSTEVNGVALSTGMYPVHGGIIANIEYRPAIDPFNPLGVEVGAGVRRGDRVMHGRYLNAPTVAELLRSHVPPLRTAVAGTKGVALLLDRQERTALESPLLVEGATQPPTLLHSLESHLGPFPAVGVTKVDRDAWTTRALVERFWAGELPAFSVLWFAEPDWSQHHTGPGSVASRQAIAGCDRQLGEVVRSLTERRLLDDTDILVVSDHGFSTIERNVDLAVDLSRIGLTTSRAFTSVPAPGTILVTGLGASSGLYVIGHGRDVIQRAVTCLQQQPYTGVIFTREAMPGTFPLALANVDSPEAPDILVCLQWSAARSTTGVVGMELSEEGAGRKAGMGTHACLSPTDLHNTLIAAGPDFRRGWTDALPSGNVDVAPTVLWLLGISPARPMDGRVLTEALVDHPAVDPSVRHWRDAASRAVGGKPWHQWLDRSSTAGVVYLDQGIGSAGDSPVPEPYSP